VPRHLLALTLLTVACGTSPATPTGPPTPPDPLPTVPTEVRTLDADDVARDAIDGPGLLQLLEQERFEGAAERTGSDRPGGIHRLAVRVLVFGEPDGAERYLTWLRSHVADVIGDAERLSDLELRVGTVPLFRHTPGDCCPKATVAYLTAWRQDATVTSLEMAGPAVDPDLVARAAGVAVR
jgi:hypothetical protein